MSNASISPTVVVSDSAKCLSGSPVVNRAAEWAASLDGLHIIHLVRSEPAKDNMIADARVRNAIPPLLLINEL
ncbi:hypothetical protein [Litchfieldia alkalitelluris]|uniref:hypothetical protein n=1 Tax=Litchfieldia alkalitelluris TaxID=304268 RepID=UPI0009964FE1|nr:hypothetical protein [Litchfieldia alkalitelluris]